MPKQGLGQLVRRARSAKFPHARLATHETTTKLIGNALLALFERSKEKSWLPSKKEQLTPEAYGLEVFLTPEIDEFLRFDLSKAPFAIG
jgi:hypothetical protein